MTIRGTRHVLLVSLQFFEQVLVGRSFLVSPKFGSGGPTFGSMDWRYDIVERH